MCNPASMIVARKNRAVFSAKTDRHRGIISEFKLGETDRLGAIDLVPVEITPPGGNLSTPLSKWRFSVDYGEYKRELPEWWDADKAESACRAKLPEWAETRLKGWKLKEAFSPIHPFKMEPKDMTRDELLALVVQWGSVCNSVWGSVCNSVGDSVCNSVWDSVCNSVWDSVRDSVWDSVRDSVRDSVWDSVRGYIGSLFHGIKEWKHLDGVKNPWRSIRKLWISGYVPSFDGKIWRLHAHADARVVFEFTKEEVEQESEAS